MELIQPLQNLITALMLLIASFSGNFNYDNLGVIEEPAEIIYAVIKNKEYTEVKYNELKTDLKLKITNREMTKINNNDLDKWKKVINRELKKCVLKKVTKIDIDTINRCL